MGEDGTCDGVKGGGGTCGTTAPDGTVARGRERERERDTVRRGWKESIALQNYTN